MIKMYDIYLDNASTTPVCEECAEIAYSVMKDHYGNPSSTHTLGRDAASILKNARGQVSAALGSKPQEVYFTSCGSESDNWAIIRGARLRSHEGRHIISSQIEHDAVRKSLDYLESEGYEITRLKPDQTGSIHIQDVLEQVRSDTILVSLMMVNNETGAITDIDSIARQVHAVNPRILVHTDAVQAFMKIPFSAKKMDVDMISRSTHRKGSVLCISAAASSFPLIFWEAVRKTVCAPELKHSPRLPPSDWPARSQRKDSRPILLKFVNARIPSQGFWPRKCRKR